MPTHLTMRSKVSDHHRKGSTTACERAPAEAWRDAVAAHLTAGRPAEAEAIARAAYFAVPNAERAYHLARTLAACDRPYDALQIADRALGGHDRGGAARVPLLLLRVVTLFGLARDDEATHAAAAALAEAPHDPDARAMAARAAVWRGDYRAALAWLDPVIAGAGRRSPTACRVVRGHALLALGRLPEAWDDWEARLETPEGAVHRRRLTLPIWDGRRSLDGQTLVVMHEQGLGDTLQFLRFIPQLRARHPGADIVLGVPPSLIPLCWAVLNEEESEGVPLPPDGLCVSIGSLPQRLRVTAAELASQGPYLRAPAHPVADAVRALPGLRVGFIWAGQQHLPLYARRSVPLDALAPIAALPGLTLVSLQAGAGAAALDACPFRDRVFDPARDGGHPLTDFGVTAAAASACDLVLTVDTSVAHLAGGLGLETWVMLPTGADWRWADGAGGNGERTPWYRTARLFRQATRGDWPGVIAAVARALGERLR